MHQTSVLYYPWVPLNPVKKTIKVNHHICKGLGKVDEVFPTLMAYLEFRIFLVSRKIQNVESQQP